MLAISWSALVSGDQVTFRDSARDPARIRTVDGEVLVEAADGGIMLRGDDGQIWIVQPEEIQRRVHATTPSPAEADDVALRWQSALPAGFETFQTAHYVVCHPGDEGYARRVGTLFESLYRAFFTYFQNLGVDLHEPSFPLVAIVFSDHRQFLKHAKAEIGSTAEHVIGYYHLQNNAMTTFRIPNLERNIATMVHEATHQLAYNCGLQTRFADNPMWVSEGMAIFFESPDFSSPRGWRAVGRVNTVNLARWKRYVPGRRSDSLRTLISDDSRFQSAATAESAYAESWALTYFLLRTRRSEFVSYLDRLRGAERLRDVPPNERIEILEGSLGMTLEEIDRAFLTYMRTVRR